MVVDPGGDGGAVAGQGAGHVGRRLALPRPTSSPRRRRSGPRGFDGHLERDPGAGRRLLEVGGDGLPFVGLARRAGWPSRPWRVRGPAQPVAERSSTSRNRGDGSCSFARPQASTLDTMSTASSISSSVTRRGRGEQQRGGGDGVDDQARVRGTPGRPPWSRSRRCPRPGAGPGPAPRPRRGRPRGRPASRAPAWWPRLGRRSRFRMSTRSGRPAAARGWPPKVVAWSPGSKARGHTGPGPAGADGHSRSQALWPR